MTRITLSILLLLSLVVPLVGHAQRPDAALIPMPNSVSIHDKKGDLSLANIKSVKSNLDQNDPAMLLLANVLKSRIGVDLNTPTGKGAEIIITNKASDKSKEAYTIDITPKQLRIEGNSPEAIYRAVTTLDQILLGDALRTTQKRVAALSIADAPRYERRALMLDPARHFLPANDVKRFIDLMASFKYNVLQLHLTDDEGWRVEIKSHPELTQNGAYYTQQELCDLVKYAAERHVEIVPELDVPGHTKAVLATHPELGCTITDTVALKKIRGNNLMLCASQPAVYTLYDDIIREVASLFPSQYIHLGGDEAAVERNWALCDHDHELMKREGYQKPADIMIYFFDRILGSVRRQGKTPILWCELDNIRMPANDYLFPYPKDVVLVTWRMGLTPKCQELTAKSGHTLLMAPGETAYLDYPQYKNDFPEFNNWGMPMTTLQKSYELEPGTNSNIQGVMGTLWGEAMPDINRVTYMAFPRALAVAEAGWSQPEVRSWESFRNRLHPVLSDLIVRGISFRVPYEIYR